MQKVKFEINRKRVYYNLNVKENSVIYKKVLNKKGKNTQEKLKYIRMKIINLIKEKLYITQKQMSIELKVTIDTIKYNILFLRKVILSIKKVLTKKGKWIIDEPKNKI